MWADASRRFRPPNCAEHKQPCHTETPAFLPYAPSWASPRTTLYRNITPDGQLTETGQRALEDKRSRKQARAEPPRNAIQARIVDDGERASSHKEPA